ncbi:hypothetical protein QBC34DRAFT_470344 [Podospora aff. communis PSN243]|uniref:Uncharacterized protein n=1 Tax=Podospora aff. communis PSN243 TaxID=3040156 RepID=A0AAV9GDJ9_9PEZI|nr:hypothetical protein QBC34DRAFT_470344 [Podospora aff. communis PSN243]
MADPDYGLARTIPPRLLEAAKLIQQLGPSSVATRLEDLPEAWELVAMIEETFRVCSHPTILPIRLIVILLRFSSPNIAPSIIPSIIDTYSPLALGTISSIPFSATIGSNITHANKDGLGNFAGAVYPDRSRASPRMPLDIARFWDLFIPDIYDHAVLVFFVDGSHGKADDGTMSSSHSITFKRFLPGHDPPYGRRFTLAWHDGTDLGSGISEALALADGLEVFHDQAVLLATFGVKQVTGLFFSDHQDNLRVLARQGFINPRRPDCREVMKLVFEQARKAMAIPGMDIHLVTR